jgi:hypothetical protein
MTATESLIFEYASTSYRVTWNGVDYDLRIGEKSELFSLSRDILPVKWQNGCAVLTSVNPQSVLLREQENQARLFRLKELLVDRHFAFGKALGIPRPGSAWQAEESFFVVGIGLAEAYIIARKFDQNAFVFIDTGGVPMLKLCDDSLAT